MVVAIIGCDKMGISYYHCFNCDFIGPEGCFERDIGDHVPDEDFCNECVDELFDVVPVVYWTENDEGTVVQVKPEDINNRRWTYTYDKETAPERFKDGFNCFARGFHEVVAYRPKKGVAWKKRMLDKIDDKETALKRFKSYVEDEKVFE